MATAGRRLDATRQGLRSRAGPRARALAAALAGSVESARTTDPVVALTFDDGPDERGTPAVLSVLGRNGARATFFVVAAEAEARPGLVHRALAAGHEVALHGAEHVPLGRASLGRSVEVVWHGRRRLARVTGTPVRWFRPPHGSQNFRAYAVARAAGMQVVSWTADASDWRPLGVDECVERALDGLAPGAILLLHDRPQPEARCEPADLLDRLLPAIAGRGFGVMPLGDLLRHRRAARAAWFKGS